MSGMTTRVPAAPKVYHILHVDRLASVATDGYLFSDARMAGNADTGTPIGFATVKQRRRAKTLTSHSDVAVSACVPFYFCPRSVMLYIISQRNHPDLEYRGGQEPIVHLEANLYETVEWATANGKRWAFTTSNAAANMADDFKDLRELGRINWPAVQARSWSGSGVDSSFRDAKQAEFLVEDQFPWALVRKIGIISPRMYPVVQVALRDVAHRPQIEIKPGWYY